MIVAAPAESLPPDADTRLPVDLNIHRLQQFSTKTLFQLPPVRLLYRARRIHTVLKTSGVILDRVSFHGRFVHLHLPSFLPSFLPTVELREGVRGHICCFDVKSHDYIYSTVQYTKANKLSITVPVPRTTGIPVVRCYFITSIRS